MSGIYDDLPDELKKIFGADGNVRFISGDTIRKRTKEETMKNPPVKGLTAKEAVWLINGGNWKPRPGDVVTLREDSPFDSTQMWPIVGEDVIVTHVWDEPKFQPVAPGSGMAMERVDFVIAYAHKCDEDGCNSENTLVEYPHDSRMYRRVGNIYEGYEPRPRPAVPGLE